MPQIVSHEKRLSELGHLSLEKRRFRDDSVNVSKDLMRVNEEEGGSLMGQDTIGTN